MLQLNGWQKLQNCGVGFKLMLPKEQKKAYTEFYYSARNNAILEPKTTLLVHMASAMALGCYP